MQSVLNRSPSKGSTTLEAELIKPIQRILKYSLFVRDATKQIKLSTIDVKGQLDSALSAVDAISSEVNASLAKNEQDKQLVRSCDSSVVVAQLCCCSSLVFSSLDTVLFSSRILLVSFF